MRMVSYSMVAVSVVRSSGMEWQLLSTTEPKNLHELRKILVQNREIEDEETFFNPPKPETLTLADVGISPEAMKQAVTRILTAVEKNERIMVFGDYDADGICATTILSRALHAVGAQQVVPFIPDRQRHGYGLSAHAIQEILTQEQPHLLITVDNGIVAHQSVAELMKAGVDVIVTDHHVPESEAGSVIWPAALVVVHTTQLCGSTVAWMVGRELEEAGTKKMTHSTRSLDLAGLATIADQVKLKDANRSFAYWGIEALKTSARPGIQALCQLAQVDQKTLNFDSVNYVLAPRINAMGRIEHGREAFELLWTGNQSTARNIAAAVTTTNTRRQDLTREMVESARAQAQTWQDEHLIMVYSAEYHEGVIGLLAGKLAEEFHKPTIALAISGKQAKASARSVAGVNVIELIRQVKADLLEVGGHPGAAGFSIETEKIELVHGKLLQLAKEQITVEMLVQKLKIDCALPARLAELPQAVEVVAVLKEFEPCGQGNPRPVLALKEMRVLAISTMGDYQQHLKLVIAAADSTQPVTCLGWGMGEHAVKLEVGQTLDVAGQLEINTWKNRQSIQLVLKSYRTEA